MIKKTLAVLLVVLLMAGLAAVYGWQQFNRYLDSPLEGPELAGVFVIEPGSSLTAVVHQLASRGLVKHPRWLVYYLRGTGQTRIQAGEYLFPSGVTRRGLLQMMSTGRVVSYQVTLVEGWTIKEALAQLHQQEGLQPLLDVGDLGPLVVELGADSGYDHPEGLFFPDTYRYVRGMSDRDILVVAYRKMQQTLAREWSERADDLPLQSAYEALVLASLVEKETSVDSERELIAGVFVTRLRKGMRLQTDPTVIYAMGDAYRGNITRRDLTIDSPYNTYRVAGLPPTPIALPSLRSIQAALNPEKTDKLYFVARGDGSHYFSATLDEHNRAVRKYQIEKRASNYRSTPAPAAAKRESGE